MLCITHLPQVAAVADEHYFIEKKLWRVGQKQASEFYLKRASKRNCAYARRSEITKLTIEHAQELLAMAKNSRSIEQVKQPFN